MSIEIKIDEEIAKLKLEVETVVRNYLSQKTNTIERDVHDILHQHQKQVVLKIIGFEYDSWGKLKLDSGNSESTASKAYKAAHIPAIQKWLDKITAIPQLNEGEMKTLVEDYEGHFLEHLRRVAREKAQEEAKKVFGDVMLNATAIIEGEFKKEELEKLRKTQEERRIAEAVRAAEQRVREQIRSEQMAEIKAKQAQDQKDLEDRRRHAETDSRELTPEL